MPALLRAAGLGLLLASCHAASSGARAPEGADSTFEYLLGKYDRDGDGVVAAGEYTRAGGAFAQLDADGDGVLTRDDFQDGQWGRDLGLGQLPAELREQLGALYAARAVVLAYFSPEDGVGAPELTREELARGFVRLDRDGSGALDAGEFARATEALPWGGPGEAWELLCRAVDPPAGAEPGGGEPARALPPDRLVALEELLAYHEALAGPAGVLRGPPGVDPRAVAPGLAGDGPPVGMLAPDFELAELDGGDRVRLSRWRGVRPVALVFGSYT